MLIDRAEDDALVLVGRGHLGQEGQFLDTRAAPGRPEVEHDEGRVAVVLEPEFTLIEQLQVHLWPGLASSGEAVSCLPPPKASMKLLIFWAPVGG